MHIKQCHYRKTYPSKEMDSHIQSRWVLETSPLRRNTQNLNLCIPWDADRKILWIRKSVFGVGAGFARKYGTESPPSGIIWLPQHFIDLVVYRNYAIVRSTSVYFHSFSIIVIKLFNQPKIFYFPIRHSRIGKCEKMDYFR